MSAKHRLKTLRRKAAKKQGWQCFYCRQPIWETDPASFCARHQVSAHTVRFLRCTAEHLQAQCDGGTDDEKNIVAACLYCNNRRHRRKRPKDAVTFSGYVRSRMKQGRWHPVRVT